MKRQENELKVAIKMARLFLKTNQKENPVSKEASNTGNFCKDKGKTGKEKA